MIKRVEAMRPRIQEITDGLIDDLLAGPKPADLVEAIALPLPSLVICELLGVPYDDRALFHRLGKTLLRRDNTPEQAQAASDELRDYLRALVDRKNGDPSDDLMSRLIVEQLRTGQMDIEDIVSMGLLLLIAGHETTANMIALGTVALLENPEQLAELRDTDDPKLVANAVEELLRYLTIVHNGRRRIALEDIEIGGEVIRAGEGVVIATEVANRDEARSRIRTNSTSTAPHGITSPSVTAYTSVLVSRSHVWNCRSSTAPCIGGSRVSRSPYRSTSCRSSTTWPSTESTHCR